MSTDKETIGQKIAREWCARWRPTILPDAAQIELEKAIDSAAADQYAAGARSVQELEKMLQQSGKADAALLEELKRPNAADAALLKKLTDKDQ